ncbi:MAG: metalloregulator ArsR/SmtB family transcription factor [Candidatus Omnitrophota bacterium]|nr:metalloregulator ArsR/SmtB family transcription factor [Candidatus Omnitrophota bacterium]
MRRLETMVDYDLVKIFKALADRTRQDILELLGEHEMNVTDICSEFETSQPTISHHLQILRNCNLVDYRKDGKNIYYYVKQEIVNDVFGTVIRKMHIRVMKIVEREKREE